MCWNLITQRGPIRTITLLFRRVLLWLGIWKKVELINLLDSVQEGMTDKRGKEGFRNFRMEVMKIRGEKTEIEENGRLIKVTEYMDVEKFFAVASATESKIEFANQDNTVDLLINSQLKIHPRAVDQMNRISGEKRKERNNLECAMRLTKQLADGNISKEKFLVEIKTYLKEYEMITEVEVEKVREMIEDRTREDNETTRELTKQFEKITSAEAYRMRTVLLEAPEKLRMKSFELAYKMAKDFELALKMTKDDTSIEIVAAWVNFKNDPLKKQEMMEKYYEQCYEWELNGLVKDGKAPEEAKTLAKENLENRRTLEEAREKTAKSKKRIAEETKIDDDLTKYHEEFSDWADEQYFEQMADSNYFKTQMEKLRTEISEIKEIAESEELTIPNPVVAYYHTRKHAKKSWNYFKNLGWEIPVCPDTEKMNNYYLIEEKKYLFEDIDNKWQAEKYISQCASFISTMFKDQDGYFGVLRGPYNATLGRAVQKRDVASHYYPKKIKKVDSSQILKLSVLCSPK